MSRLTSLLLAVAAVLATSGCAVVSPRQTLAVLDDGTVAFAEGRKDVCLAVEDGAGTELHRVCDIDIEPRGMGEAALLPVGDRVVMIAVIPLDATEVQVVEPGEGVVEVLERIESDITTGFVVGELDPALGEIELIGTGEAAANIGTSAPFTLPTGSGPVHVRADG